MHSGLEGICDAIFRYDLPILPFDLGTLAVINVSETQVPIVWYFPINVEENLQICLGRVLDTVFHNIFVDLTL